MEIIRLSDCLKNSWCVEKHWDAILRVLTLAKTVEGYDDLSKAIADLEAIK